MSKWIPLMLGVAGCGQPLLVLGPVGDVICMCAPPDDPMPGSESFTVVEPGPQSFPLTGHLDDVLDVWMVLDDEVTVALRDTLWTIDPAANAVFVDVDLAPPDVVIVHYTTPAFSSL
ncbi:MAG: hypothetical protein R3F61_33805 [Myxococcota bacterium]